MVFQFINKSVRLTTKNSFVAQVYGCRPGIAFRQSLGSAAIV
jgi:hypothetical protein